MIAASLLVSGVWLRLLVATGSLYWILLGSVVTCLAPACTHLCTNKVPSNWFGTDERGLATSIAHISWPIGSLISVVFPVLFINDTPNHLKHPEKDRNDFITFLSVNAIVVTIMVLPSILGLAKNRPKTPPSATAGKIRKHFKCKDVKKLLKNKNYLLLAVVYICHFACQELVGGFMSFFIAPFGYGP